MSHSRAKKIHHRASDSVGKHKKPPVMFSPGRLGVNTESLNRQGITPRDHEPAIIDLTTRALSQILLFTAPADSVLRNFFRAYPKMGARDRARLAEAIYDVLRHLRRYRHYAESGKGPLERRLALLGLYSAAIHQALEPARDLQPAASSRLDKLNQTIALEQPPTAGGNLSGLKAILSEVEYEWLEHVARIPLSALPIAIKYSFPDWLYDAVLSSSNLTSLDPALNSLLTALNQPAPLDLRINPLKTNREAVLDKILSIGVPATPTSYSPLGIRLLSKPPIQQWSIFMNGSIEVQDEGSQLLGLLLGPKRGEMVIDFCAGAGGKTLLIGALMRSTGRLYAFDTSEKRLARMKPRLSRSGLSNVTPILLAHENDPRVKRLSAKADRVLVDAPCSGTGTLRRNPDLKWRHTPQDITELVALQKSILASAARCVKPGGRLVYATCSLLRQENEEVINAFLAENKQFEREDALALLATKGVTIPFVPEGTGFVSEDCGVQCKAQNVDGSLTPSRLCNAAMRPQDRSQDSIFGYEGYLPSASAQLPTQLPDLLAESASPASLPPTDLRLRPDTHGTDAFYAAVLTRKKLPVVESADIAQSDNEEADIAETDNAEGNAAAY